MWVVEGAFGSHDRIFFKHSLQNPCVYFLGLIFDNDDGRNNDEGSQDEFVSAHQDVEENNIPSQSSFRIDDNLDLQDNFEEPTSALLVYSPVKHSVDDAKSSSILLLSHDSNYDNNFNNRDSDCSSIISDGSDTNINTTVTSLTLNRDKYVAEKLSSKLLKSLSLKTTTAAIVPSSLPKSKISKSAKNSMMPDYSVMSHADLKKLGSKYGLRPGPKSFLVYELELIWKSLHCQNEGAVVSQQQQQCLGLFSTLAASAASYKKSGKSTAASVSQDPTSSTQPCSLSPEQQVAVASKSESRQALVHSSLKRFIVSTPLLYSQILRYEVKTFLMLALDQSSCFKLPFLSLSLLLANRH